MLGNHQAHLYFCLYFSQRVPFYSSKNLSIFHYQILSRDQYGEQNKQNEDEFMHGENKNNVHEYYFVYFSFTHLILNVLNYLLTNLWAAS